MNELLRLNPSLNPSLNSCCLVLRCLGHPLARTAFGTCLADLLLRQELFECIHPLDEISIVGVKLLRDEILIVILVLRLLKQTSFLALAA